MCRSYVVVVLSFKHASALLKEGRQNGIGDLIKDAEETSTGAPLKATTAIVVFVTWRENIKTYSPILLLFSLSHFLLLLSIFPLLPTPPVLCACIEVEGFWCCPRQWTIWVISCAPVSYDFGPRQCCSRAFCLAGLSHGSQTSLFLPFPFHVACVNEPSPQLLWCDLVIYPLDPMTEGLTCSVNCVSDTASQVFHRDSLST